MSRLRGHAHRARARSHRDRSGGRAGSWPRARFVRTRGSEASADTGADLESQRDPVRARAAQVYARVARAERGDPVGMLERSFASLASVRGRKSVILVSGGLHQRPAARAASGGWSTESRRANAALYFLDARGLTGAPSNLSAESGTRIDFNDLGATLTEAKERSEGSHSLAADTGGFSVRERERPRRRASSASPASRRATTSSATRPPTSAPTAGSARSRSRWRATGADRARAARLLRARRARAAPAARPLPSRATPPSRALSTRPSTFRACPCARPPTSSARPSRARCGCSSPTEADIRGLAFEERGGASKDTLETMLVVAERQTGEFHRFDQQFDMSFQPETRARYEKTWFPIDPRAGPRARRLPGAHRGPRQERRPRGQPHPRLRGGRRRRASASPRRS